MTLSDRVVLITGGKRIGQGVARAVAAKARIVATAYRGSRAEADETGARRDGAGPPGP